MVQPDVTAADVLTTIDDFDRLGRTEFLSKYGYGESRRYFLNHGGRFYDSKAIVGVAHQVRHGQPLIPEDFSGGDATVAAVLRRLGFVLSQPNPPWTLDEIVLACDLVRQDDATAEKEGCLSDATLPASAIPSSAARRSLQPAGQRAVSLAKFAASTLSTPTANGAPTSSSAIIALLSTSREPPTQTSPISHYFARTATA